jgi:hypothetical protein
VGLGGGGFDLKNEGVVGVAGRERLSQAPRRWKEVEGVEGVGEGGVIGFESSGPLKVRFGGTSLSGAWVRPGGCGGAGRGLVT